MAMVPTESRPLSLRNRLFLRRVQQSERPSPHRPLTASAKPLDLGDKIEARKLRVLRQGWQSDAAAYVKAVPELSFAYRFLANASSRMRYFPALVNPEEPDGPPIPAHEHPGAPAGLVDSMNQAMAALGVGRLALAPMQESLSYSFGVTGECFLVGTSDQSVGDDGSWKIRSIEEFMVFDDAYKLREVPLDPAGMLGWVDLDPETTYASRMWIPDFMYSALATSPMRALLDTAEELLLLSRDVRSVARSRLAGGGILKIPEGLRMLSLVEDNEDPESEDWFGRFAEAMMTPLADEGTASAVVPIGVSGAPDDLRDLEHLLIDRPYSALAIELRAEAIGRIATGLDFPREILEGIGDVNHWSGALVSEENFRHHIEPQVIKQVDAMTVAFLRSWLTAAGFPAFWVNRACIWYNPVDLVSKPDPMANAVPLFDRFAINYQALREAGGFTEDDAPSTLEFYARQLAHIRSFPPNVLEAIIHAVDPQLEIPPIMGSGQVPGMGPKGAVQPTSLEPTGLAPDTPAPAASPAPPAPAPAPKPTLPPTPPAGPSSGPPVTAPQGVAQAVTFDPIVFTAERDDREKRRRLARRLTEIDAHLRSRVQTAAASAMIRLLDRAGAKLRTKVQDRKFRDADAKALVASTGNRYLAVTLGEPIVAALGFPDAHALLNPDWGDLRDQFASWVSAAQAEAVRVARQLAGLPADDKRVRDALDRLDATIDSAWTHLEGELNRIAETLLYHPDPSDDGTVTVNPDTLIPPGVVRAALTIAGGSTPRSLTAAGQESVLDPTRTTDVGTALSPPGDNPPGRMISVRLPDGQIGNGGAIGDMLGAADMVPVSFTWEHLGVSTRPFEPHLDLDGTTFTSFDDEALSNHSEWPEVSHYLPGDHEGCGCDYSTEWGPRPETTTSAPSEGMAATAEALTSDELQAAVAYQDDSYGAINEALRSGNLTSSAQSTVDLIDSAIARQEPLQDTLTVFRAFNNEVLRQMSDGDFWSDKGFLSTSNNLDRARTDADALSDIHDADHTVVEIVMRPGAKVLDYSKLGPSVTDDAEVLIPRDTEFEVEIQRDGKIVLRSVPPDDVSEVLAAEPAAMAAYPSEGFSSAKDAAAWINENWPGGKAQFSLGGLKPDIANEVGKVLTDLARQYPDVAKTLNFFGGNMKDLPSWTPRMPSGAVAYSTHFQGDGLIRMNLKAIQDLAMLTRSKAQGFTTGGTPGSVIAHEFGHQWADKIVGYSSKKDRDEIIMGVLKKYADARGYDTSNLRAGRWRYDVVRSDLSRYATTNNEELLAEAFSEVYDRGDQARELARSLVDALEKFVPLKTGA